MEAYMGCMLEECVVRECYLRKHGNREGVNKWLIDWSIDGSMDRYQGESGYWFERKICVLKFCNFQ